MLCFSFTVGSCLHTIQLLVFSTNHRYALSQGPHAIEIVTYSENATFEIHSQHFWNNSANELELNLRSNFGFTTCVHKSDIKSVSIVPLSCDGLNVNTIVTFVCDSEHLCSLLTQDLDVDYSVDSDGKEKGAPLVLSQPSF